jgi:hypothetical protein
MHARYPWTTVSRRRPAHLDAGINRRWMCTSGAAAALLAVAVCAPVAHGKQVIQACYNPSYDRGELRVLSARSCDSSEKELRWNKAAPRGPPGPHGSPGLRGERGEPGDDDGYEPDDDPVHSSQSLPEKVIEWAGLYTAALLSALLALLIGFLLLMQALTRFRLTKNMRLIRWLRPTSFVVEPLDDRALGEPSIGAAITGLVRNRISARGVRYGGDYVTGQKIVRKTLKSFKDLSASFQNLSGTAGTALAVIDFLARTLPRRRFVLRGELQPAGVAGPGLSLALQDNAAEDALTVLWATPLEVRADGVAAYQRLAIPAAAWTDHQLTSALEREAPSELLSQNADSWAVFRAGLECHRLGEDEAARSLYEQSLGHDGDNLGALANLGLLERRERRFRRGAELLKRAHDEFKERDEAFAFNPDWYRIQYHLAALYLNRASVTGDTARLGNDAQTALEMSKALALESVSMIVEPEALPPIWRRLKALQSKASIRKERDELLEFLTATIAPSALMLLAGALLTDAAPTPPVERRARELGTYRDVLNVLKSSEVDGEALVTFVEAQPQLAPRVYYNLACYQVVSAGEERVAKEWLERAFLHTTMTERYALLRIVEKDTTLQPLTADLEYLEELRVYLPERK